jgi:alkylation response protein AidB-like acyl-CoA dehydrogenase
MDFDFTDDQLSLRDAVQRWVDKGFGFERRHALAKAGGATRAVYTELAELGLTGLAVPEAHGGMGQGAIEAMVVMEELGRGLVNAPTPRRADGAGLLAARTGGVQADWLPRMASGEPWWCRRLQERAARYRLNHVATRPRRRASAWRPDGQQERGAGWRRGRCLHRAGAHCGPTTIDEPASACSWWSARPA